MNRVRVSQAARQLGVHPDTIRRWADAGVLPFVRVAGQRRFLMTDVEALAVNPFGGPVDCSMRREALYVRVSSTTGQDTSLVSQETELRGAATGRVVAVFKDRASGLRENRPGLARLLQGAVDGKFDVVRVTHEDRLARFGVGWIVALLARDSVTVEVLHPKGNPGGVDELLADFMSLVASFAGRMYGIRGQAAKTRLLNEVRTMNGETDD